MFSMAVSSVKIVIMTNCTEYNVVKADDIKSYRELKIRYKSALTDILKHQPIVTASYNRCVRDFILTVNFHSSLSIVHCIFNRLI